MSKVIGIQNNSFTGKDGTLVTGTTLFVTDPIDPKRGRGEEAEKIFLSTAKMTALNLSLEVGSEVQVLYNKYGKVAAIKKLDGGDLDFGPDIK